MKVTLYLLLLVLLTFLFRNTINSILEEDKMEYRVINFSSSPVMVENRLSGDQKKSIHLAPGEKVSMHFDKELFTLSFDYQSRGDISYRIKDNLVVFY